MGNSFLHFKTNYTKNIHCPWCGKEYICDEGDEDLITYWGDGDIQEVLCYHCDKTFYVNEYVERTFKSGKVIKDYSVWFDEDHE